MPLLDREECYSRITDKHIIWTDHDNRISSTQRLGSTKRLLDRPIRMAHIQYDQMVRQGNRHSTLDPSRTPRAEHINTVERNCNRNKHHSAPVKYNHQNHSLSNVDFRVTFHRILGLPFE